MKYLLIAILFYCTATNGQTRYNIPFGETQNKITSVCTSASGSYLTETDVKNLITGMLEMLGVENGYIIKNCIQVDNCQAILFEGKPYILYNASFLNEVKKLNFTESNLPEVATKNWRVLSILAHELGHHVNNHLLNPKQESTQKEMELEADKTSGFMIYLMGGSLDQAQQAYMSLSEKGDYSHPGRMERLMAVKKGWSSAAAKYPNVGNKRVVPDVPVTNDQIDVWTALQNFQEEKAEEDMNVKRKEFGTKDWNDGSTYKQVKIKYKTWMAENLNVTRYNNGDVIPHVQDQKQWAALTTGAWCFYKNVTDNGIEFGRLYNWYAVNDPRGLAPEGWHIPTESEWKHLIEHFGGESEAGGQMKADFVWNGIGAIKNTWDKFEAMPGGRRSEVGSFASLKDEGIFWTATESKGNQVIAFKLVGGMRAIFTTWRDKREGFSVRCVKD